MKSSINRTWACDFCHCSNKREVVYTPQGSLRDTKIILCSKCGLVSSTYEHTVKKRLVSASSEANWGNIRHGKGLRLDKQKDVLLSMVPWSTIRTVLDIGSNRGHFVLWVKGLKPSAAVTAIEPDSLVIDTYKKVTDKLILDRFENVLFPKDTVFDFIYCSHTLEHSYSAVGMLTSVRNLLSPKGLAYIEVPNIEVIGKSDIIEEYFIDKHTFHFHPDILKNLLGSVGLSIKKQYIDQYNIGFLVQKTKPLPEKTFSNTRLVSAERKLIYAYQLLLPKNRRKLKFVAEKLNEFSKRQKVVYWGGGRIFDALVTFGKLDTSRIAGVVDSYLSNYLEKVHEVKLHSPTALRFLQPDVVVILAQSSAEEIEHQARSFGSRHVIKFRDLFQTT